MATKTVAKKETPASKVKVAKSVDTKASTGKKVAPGAAVKETFTKASLTARLAQIASVEPKSVKAILAALEDTMLGAVHKKGAGVFTLPGLLKITAQAVPAKKKRFGKDPFTGEERWFDPKPATVRLKARPLKKLKDAAA